MTSLLKPFLFAVLLLPVLDSDLLAQRPLQRLQRGWDDIRPRGKILRELFGDKKEDETRQKKTAQQQLDARRRQQGHVPNQGTRNRQYPTGNQRATATRGRQPVPATSIPGSTRGAAGGTAKAHPRQLELAVSESKKPAGLTVRKAGRSGAGYLAGIRQGDVIVSIGGLNVAAREDMDNITGILKDGDQIEFEVIRRGKKETRLVQFGEAPAGENAAQAAPAAAGDYRAAPRSGTPDHLRSVLEGDFRSGQRLPAGQSARGAGSAANGPNWHVQPPGTGNASPPASSRRVRNPLPARQTAPQDIAGLRRLLAAREREIEELRRQLLQQSARPPQGQRGQEDLEFDPLLDFKKEN